VAAAAAEGSIEAAKPSTHTGSSRSRAATAAVRPAANDEGRPGLRADGRSASVGNLREAGAGAAGAASVSSAARLGSPQKLAVRVLQVEKTKDGKSVFVIECELDARRWSVLRQEVHVQQLHRDLASVMRFLPDTPLEKGKRWVRRENVRKRLEDFLRQITANEQWVWDECAVLRQFLEIPISTQNRQAREQLHSNTPGHKTVQLHSQLFVEASCDDEAALNAPDGDAQRLSDPDDDSSPRASDASLPGPPMAEPSQPACMHMAALSEAMAEMSAKSGNMHGARGSGAAPALSKKKRSSCGCEHHWV